MKLIYNDTIYPRLISPGDQEERQEVLIPEISGDYFLSIIDDGGGYMLVEHVAEKDVKIFKESFALILEYSFLR